MPGLAAARCCHGDAAGGATRARPSRGNGTRAVPNRNGPERCNLAEMWPKWWVRN